MSASVSENLAQNLRALRESRGYSQPQIAKIAGVPRPTWTHLESGAANPTLAVLIKVADALAVRIEELLGPPKSFVKFYPASTVPQRKRGKVAIKMLLPESLAGLQIERMELAIGARMTGTPHTDGTREYLTCESGTVGLFVAGESFRLEPGDVVVFRGDQKHGYQNLGRKIAVAYSVISFAAAEG